MTMKRRGLILGRRRETTVAAAALALTFQACDAEPTDERDEEPLAQTSEAIVDGVSDTEFSADYPGSVMLESSFGTRCSGTLVTPRWVLTAAHCIEETDDDGIERSKRTWTVFVSPMGNQGGTAIPLDRRTFVHTHVTSKTIPTHDGPSEPFEQRDTDLALVRLDERVPHPIGLHAALPEEAGSCGPRFAGKLVGFSPAGYEQPTEYPSDTRFICFDEPGGWRRRTALSLRLWDNHLQGDAAVYTHLFAGPPGEICEGLAGIGTSGDSGGSLYKHGSPPVLCGVISGDGPDNTEGGYSVGFTSNYHTSALDHIINILWWRDGITARGEVNHGGIFDADGFLEETYEPRGDCPDEFTEDPPDACDDPDFDGIASLYDNCPGVHNPEQLTTHDDAENGGLGDGIGDACDACPDTEGGDTGPLTNRNHEVEALMADRAGLVQPKHPDQFDSTADFEAAKLAWRAAFRPDACDPTPIPLQDLRDGGDLPDLGVPGAFPPPPAGCLFQEDCELVVRNAIHIDGRPTEDTPPGTNAKLGLRFCDCSAVVAASTSTLTGRQECSRDTCQYDPAAYDAPATSPWRAITTPETDSGWTPLTTNREWIGPPQMDVDVFWDFRTLGTAVTTTPSSQSVKGILWATFREVDGLPTNNVEAFAASLGTGDASWRWAGGGARRFESISDWFFCTTCPMRFQNPLLTQGNPDWRVTILGGSMPFDTPDDLTRSHHEAVARGELLHVGMSEPFSALARAFPSDQRVVRSVGLRDGAIVSVLEGAGLDGMPSARGKVPTRAASAEISVEDEAGPAEGRAWVFSATKQRLFAIGGVDAQGQALDEGFMQDFSSDSWRRFAFPAGESVGAVLAAVYRFEDQAVYFLDRDGPRVRLRRWNAQRSLLDGVVQTLAELPAPGASSAGTRSSRATGETSVSSRLTAPGGARCATRDFMSTQRATCRSRRSSSTAIPSRAPRSSRTTAST